MSVDNTSATTARRTGRPQRKSRVPLAEQRDTLTVADQEPGFVYRWVNDVEDRVNKFKLAGYDVVNTPTTVGDTKVEDGLDKTSSIVEKAVGGKTKAVLMRIPEEWYDEDQAKKQKKNDAIDAAMKRDRNNSDYGEVRVGTRRT